MMIPLGIFSLWLLGALCTSLRYRVHWILLWALLMLLIALFYPSFL